MNSPEMRKFLYKTKDTGSLEKRLSFRTDLEGNLHLFPGSEARAQGPAGPDASKPDPQQNYFDPNNLSYLDVVSLAVEGKTWLVTLVANRSGGTLLEVREIQDS